MVGILKEVVQATSGGTVIEVMLSQGLLQVEDWALVGGKIVNGRH